jgi:hypothetical protein
MRFISRSSFHFVIIYIFQFFITLPNALCGWAVLIFPEQEEREEPGRETVASGEFSLKFHDKFLSYYLNWCLMGMGFISTALLSVGRSNPDRHIFLECLWLILILERLHLLRRMLIRQEKEQELARKIEQHTAVRLPFWRGMGMWLKSCDQTDVQIGVWLDKGITNW